MEAPATLDRAKFSRDLPLWGLVIPKKECQGAMKLLRGYVLNIPGLRNVRDVEDKPDCRLVLLVHTVIDSDLTHLREDVRKAIATRGWTARPFTARLEYAHFSTEQVLKELLPPGVDAPSSFETVGHIAHLNLREEVLPYKALVGEVLLDKNGPTIRTILNKVGIIESEFRVPTFELLAGDPNLECEVKQHGAVFKLNFGEVYWNSRLEQEHNRLVQQLRPGEALCDMMAGIGPFAVPAARRGHVVYANDLNPRCAHYLRANTGANKVSNMVFVANMDGRQFLRDVAGGWRPPPACEEPSASSGGAAADAADAGEATTSGRAAPFFFSHVVMNLPATAIEFLDCFKGAFRGAQWTAATLPTVHCYSFLKGTETPEELKLRAEGHLGGPIPDETWRIVIVRDVAPNKEMVCITFKLPADIAFAAAEDCGNGATTDSRKKMRLEDGGTSSPAAGAGGSSGAATALTTAT